MPERVSWVERATEMSKRLDDVGIVVGLGMIAMGIIYSPLLIPGVAVAGTSVGTKWGAEKVRKWAERRRKKK